MSIAVDIAMIVTPIVIGVGFIFAYRQWKATSNARMAQVILEISGRWDCKELKQSRQKVNENAERLKQAIEQVNAKNSEDLYDLVEVGNYFDTVGVLVMEGSLSCRIAYDLFSESVEHYYNIYKPILADPKYKDVYKYFVQLHEAFIIEKARRLTATPRPPV